jgi:hypothetical protein
VVDAGRNDAKGGSRRKERMSYCDPSILAPECGGKLCSRCYPSEEKKRLDHTMNQIQDNLELSSRLIFIKGE